MSDNRIPGQNNNKDKDRQDQKQNPNEGPDQGGYEKKRDNNQDIEKE
jgi:hypothetical protein